MTGEKSATVLKTQEETTRNSQGVLAWLGCIVAKRIGEELHVRGLVLTDLRKASALPGRHSSLHECMVVVARESFHVEGVLEVLEGERELEDLGDRRSDGVSLALDARDGVAQDARDGKEHRGNKERGLHNE